MRSLLALASLAACAAPPDPLRFVPAEPLAVLRVQCGDRWQQELRQTRLGQALADEALHAAWRGWWTGKALADVPPEAKQRLDGLWSALAGYGGEVVVAARLDPATLGAAIAGEQAPAVAGMIALGPDGRTDLAALAARLTALLPTDEAKDATVAGVPVRLLTKEPVQATLPFVHCGCIVALVGTDLARQAAWFLDAGPQAWRGAPGFRTPVASAQVELAGVAPTLRDVLPAPGLPDGMLPRLWHVLGLNALARAGWQLRGAGPDLEQEAWMEFTDAPRGLFGAWLPAHAGGHGLLRHLPAGCRTFTASRFDLQALHRLYADAFAELGDTVPMTRAQVEEEFTRFTRLRLQEDLVALAGDEYLQIVDLGDVANFEFDADEGIASAMEARFGHTTWVFAVRDGVQLAKNLDTVVRARGLHAARKTEEYAGTKVHRIVLLGAFPIEYAVTPSLLVVGLGKGEGTAKTVRAVLDNAAAIAAGQPGTTLAADVEAVVRARGTDWAGLQCTSLTEALRGVLGMLDSLLAAGVVLDEDEPGLSMVQAIGRPLQQACAKHGVDLVISTEHAATQRFVVRTRM